MKATSSIDEEGRQSGSSGGACRPGSENRPPRKIFVVLAIAVFAALALFAVACGGSDDDSDSGSNSQSGEVTDVSLVSSIWVGTGPFVVAHDKGLDRENGVNFDIKIVEEFKDITSTLGSGRADVAFSVGPGQAMTILQADIPAEILMVGDVSIGGDRIHGSPDVRSVADLEGKRVGIETATVGYPMLIYALEQEGLTLDDIDPVELTASQAAAALQSGRVDAAYTYEPYVSQLLKAGYPDIYKAGDEIGIVSDLLLGTDVFVEDNPEAAVGVIKSWEAGLDYIRQNPQESYTIIADELGFPRSDVVDLVGDPETLRFFDLQEASDYLNDRFSELLPTFVSVVNEAPNAPRELSVEEVEEAVNPEPLETALSDTGGN